MLEGSFPSQTCGVTDRAALKQSTALSYSPLRLNRTPSPHWSCGSTWVGSEFAACRNKFCTSVNKDLHGGGEINKQKGEKNIYIGQHLRLGGCWMGVPQERRTHSGSSDPNLSLSESLPLAPSFWRSRSCCSHTGRYLGLCFSQSRRVSQACLCSDSLVKLTASVIRAVRLLFFSSMHLEGERGAVRREKAQMKNKRKLHLLKGEDITRLSVEI